MTESSQSSENVGEGSDLFLSRFERLNLASDKSELIERLVEHSSNSLLLQSALEKTITCLNRHISPSVPDNDPVSQWPTFADVKGLNQYKHAISKRLLQNTQLNQNTELQDWSPLFFYGPVGCGITHLIHGCIRESNRNMSCIEITPYLLSTNNSDHFYKAVTDLAKLTAPCVVNVKEIDLLSQSLLSPDEIEDGRDLSYDLAQSLIHGTILPIVEYNRQLWHTRKRRLYVGTAIIDYWSRQSSLECPVVINKLILQCIDTSIQDFIQLIGTSFEPWHVSYYDKQIPPNATNAKRVLETFSEHWFISLPDRKAIFELLKTEFKFFKGYQQRPYGGAASKNLDNAESMASLLKWPKSIQARLTPEFSDEQLWHLASKLEGGTAAQCVRIVQQCKRDPMKKLLSNEYVKRVTVASDDNPPQMLSFFEIDDDNTETETDATGERVAIETLTHRQRLWIIPPSITYMGVLDIIETFTIGVNERSMSKFSEFSKEYPFVKHE